MTVSTPARKPTENSHLITQDDANDGLSTRPDGGSTSGHTHNILYKSSSSAIVDHRHDIVRHDNPDDHNHHHSISSHRHLSENVPLYSAPRQRQRWDEIQVLPHVNWGDLYFDLFYVSAAYNLSHGFKADPTINGFIWFVACYLPIFQIWNEKLVFDARYSPEDNIFHRSLELLHLCILGTIVWYIQPSFIMSDLRQYPTTMVYAGGCSVDALFYIYWYYDLYKNAIGGPEARRNAYIALQRKSATLAVYTVAFCIASYQHLVVGESQNATVAHQINNNNNWPAYVLIGGYVFEFIVFNLTFTFWYLPKLGSHKDYFVPINLEYVTHRIGEWVMLMLGESVLSILTGGSGGAQTSQSGSYSISFYCGILTVTMFQYLFFRTQPSEGKDHAMRRSQLGGYMFFYFHTIYSASLILVGCSFKMMLSPEEMIEELEERYGGSGDKEEHDDGLPYNLNRRIAFVYAVSQTISFLASDAMLWTHRGFNANIRRFFRPNGRIVMAPWLILGIEAVLLTLTMSLSQIEDLTLLSISGCLLVLSQVVLRTFSMRHFPISVEAMERALANDYTSIRDEDHRRWPNVTEPGN